MEISENFPVLLAVINDEKFAAGYTCSFGHELASPRLKSSIYFCFAHPISNFYFHLTLLTFFESLLPLDLIVGKERIDFGRSLSDWRKKSIELKA